MLKLIISLAFLVSISFAEQEKDTSAVRESSYSKITCKNYSNYIGIAGGFTAGYGLSYRRWINNKHGIQINFLPIYYTKKYNDDYYDIDSGYSKYGHVSLGLTYLKNLASSRYLRFIFYSGFNIRTIYERDNYYEYYYNDPQYHVQKKNLENRFTLGTGAGTEWYVWRFSFHLMLGLRVFYTKDDNTLLDEKIIDNLSILPSIEGGLHFRY